MISRHSLHLLEQFMMLPWPSDGGNHRHKADINTYDCLIDHVDSPKSLIVSAVNRGSEEGTIFCIKPEVGCWCSNDYLPHIHLHCSFSSIRPHFNY